jgi:fructokinase
VSAGRTTPGASEPTPGARSTNAAPVAAGASEPAPSGRSVATAAIAPEDVILVGGEALYDLVYDGHEDLQGHPGGAAFNTSRTIGRLGQPVAYLGRLSTDRFGTTLERMLAADGVRLDAVVRTDEPTTLALAELDETGSARYRFYERATSAPGLTPEVALAALPPAVGILHVGTLGLTLEPMATALEAVVEELGGEALVMVDPNVRPWVIGDADTYRRRLRRVIGRSDVVKVSEEDIAWLEPQRSATAAARMLLQAGPRVVLLTRGGDGVQVVTGAGDVPVAAPAIEVVDTIGAGDAFGGGFLAWWRSQGLGREQLGDQDAVVEAARFGALVAARTCERAGASPPYLSELGPTAPAAAAGTADPAARPAAAGTAGPAARGAAAGTAAPAAPAAPPDER